MAGKLFIISAPSGTGKTSILKIVMENVENVAFSVSHTTRMPREGEVDSSDYYFVGRERFLEMIEEKAFLEWAQVHDNYYGTAIGPISQQLEQGADVVLDIDVQGAAIIRQESRLPATHIFIAPPDFTELEKRLRGRGTEDEESVQKRLENGREEMSHSNKYDYFIVNDTLEQAALMACSIIYAERSRDRRSIKGNTIEQR